MPFQKHLLSLFLFFIVQFSFAQTDTLKYYLDSDEKPVERTQASFLVKVYKQNPGDLLWRKETVTYVDNKLISTVGCSDPSGKIKQGEYLLYSFKHELIKKGYYQNDKPVGEWTGWSASGNKISSYIFIDGKMAGLSKEWYSSGKLADSFNVDTNGNGPGIGFYENGRKRYEGLFADGVKKGPWKYYYDLPNSPQSMEAVFEKDSLTGSKCFTAEGGKQSRDCYYFKEARFEGGDKAWVSYLVEAITNSKFTKHLKPGNKYTAIVAFMITKDGKVKDVTVEDPDNERLDDLAEKIIRNSPDWEPAIQYNQPVNAYRRQPITFVVDKE